MKEGWQTALSLVPYVSGEREQASAAIVSRGEPGVRRERRVPRKLQRWRDGVDINTFDGTKRIIREWDSNVTRRLWRHSFDGT